MVNGRLPPAGVALTAGVTHAFVFVACASTGAENGLTDSIASMIAAAYVVGMIAVAVATRVYPMATLWAAALIYANAYRWGSGVVIVADPLLGPSSGRLMFLAGQTALIMGSLATLSRLESNARGSDRMFAASAGMFGMLSVVGILACDSGWASMPPHEVARSLFASRRIAHPTEVNSLMVDGRSIGQGQVVWLYHGSVVVMNSTGSLQWVRSANGGRAITLQTCMPCKQSFDDAALFFSLSALSALGVVISASSRRFIGWRWRDSSDRSW